MKRTGSFAAVGKAQQRVKRVSIADSPEAASKDELSRARAALSPVLNKTLQWINSYLILHKSEILITKAMLEDGFMHNQQAVINEMDTTADAEGNREEPMPDQWSKTYSTMKSLPKYFIAKWLAEGPPNLGKRIVDLVDTVSPSDGLRKVFGFFSGLLETSWWAPRLHTRDVLVAWLSEQFAEIGGNERRTAFLEAVDDKTGVVDWDALLPFEMVWSKTFDGDEDFQGWADDALPTITHIQTRFLPVKRKVRRVAI